MIVFPAIDIKDGKCVRLKQGDFNQVDTFGTDPSKMAVKWEAEGGTFLHIVDLDGALKGNTANKEAVKRIIEKVNVPVQFGGGMRNEAAIKTMLDMGISRVILGTSALKDKAFTKDMIGKYGDQIAVSIDAKNGLVAVDGWTNVSETKAVDLAQELVACGLKTIVYTDISKDGMMAGPNFEELDNMNKNVDADIIASGGISSIADVIKLSEMNLYGAIIGKALYTGAIELAELKNQMEA